MAIEDQVEISGSLLDKLAPQGDAPVRRFSADSIEESIIRDLEMLLNTRREEFLIPPEFEQTATSIVNFGIPDLSKCGSLRFGPEQTKLSRWIEDAIRIFEPRLCNVAVRVADRENVNPVLRFRVEAKAEFTAQRVAFELGLNRDNGELAILPGTMR